MLHIGFVGEETQLVNEGIFIIFEVVKTLVTSTPLKYNGSFLQC